MVKIADVHGVDKVSKHPISIGSVVNTEKRLLKRIKLPVDSAVYAQSDQPRIKKDRK